ncbi:MAG: [LysW]-aminoadipate kinase [Bacillota bacterium]
MLVLKIGGGLTIDRGAFCRDAASLVREGRQVVLVHGGSAETDEVSLRLGKPPRFVTSVSGYRSRLTDEKTMEIFSMVYAGKLNTAYTSLLRQLGVNALGLSGVDGGLAAAQRKEALKIVEDGRRRVLRGDRSGRIERINGSLLRLLLREGYVPVVSPPAISRRGEVLNVDGDRMAAAIAGELGAEVLVMFTDRPGFLRDPDCEESLIERVSAEDLEEMGECARGRMRIKLLAAREALDAGVSRVIIADGRRTESPVRSALAGEGTVIAAAKSGERAWAR